MPLTRPAPRTVQNYAAVVLIYHLAVIVWGAFVRATGSGAGCGEHWPLCNGAALPPSPTLATVIEWSHRFTSGIAVALLAGLVLCAFRSYGRGHLIRRAALFAVFFELMEAVIGAALVLLGQTGRNTSTGRGVTLSLHLVNTLLLLAALTVVFWAAGEKRRHEFRSGSGNWAIPLGLGFGSMILLGVSGAIAALGDTLFRTSSLRSGMAADFAAGAHPFLRLRIWHPGIAAVVVLGLAVLIYRVVASDAEAGARRWAIRLGIMLAAQITIGLINLALLAPIPLQLAHLLLADLAWIFLVLLAIELSLKPAKQDVEVKRTVPTLVAAR